MGRLGKGGKGTNLEILINLLDTHAQHIAGLDPRGVEEDDFDGCVLG
jgi:hypothetical protein